MFADVATSRIVVIARRRDSSDCVILRRIAGSRVSEIAFRVAHSVSSIQENPF